MHAARMIGSRAAWTAAARVMLALATMVAPAGAQGRGGRGQQAEPEPLKWRFMGPSVGNRIAAVAGVPGDPTIYYAGAASGGVWKSTDGGATLHAGLRRPAGRRDRRARRRAVRPQHRLGRHRRSVGDPRATSSATASTSRPTPARPGRTWASTKPAASAASSSTRRIPTSSTPARSGARPVRSRSAASSRRPTAAARGSACCSSTRTPAAPASRWMRRIPSVLFAGTWQVEMHPWAMLSGGPGSGIYVTRDGGATWTQRDAQRTSEVARRQDRRRRRAVRLQPRLRAHSDRRPGLALALGRRRARVEGRQLGPRAHRPRRLLHPSRHFARRRGRSARREQQLTSLDRRRASPSSRGAAAATATTSGSIRRTPIASR